MDFAGLLFFLDASSVFPGLVTCLVCGLAICKFVWKVSFRQLDLNQVAALLFAAVATTTSPMVGNVGFEIPPQSSITGHLAIGMVLLVVAVVLVARKDLPKTESALAAGAVLFSLLTLSAVAGNAGTMVIATFPGIELARWVVALGAVVLVASMVERNLGSACVLAAACLVAVGISGARLGPWVAPLALVLALAAAAGLAGTELPRQRFWIVAMFGFLGVAGVILGLV